MFSGVFCGPKSFGNGLVESANDYFIQLSDDDAIYADKRLPEVYCLSIICAGSVADVTTALEASSESEIEPDHGMSTSSGLPDKPTTVQQEPTADNDSDMHPADKSVTDRLGRGVCGGRGRGTRGHAGQSGRGGRTRGDCEGGSSVSYGQTWSWCTRWPRSR